MAPFPRNVFGSAYRRRRLLPKHQWQAIESVQGSFESAVFRWYEQTRETVPLVARAISPPSGLNLCKLVISASRRLSASHSGRRQSPQNPSTWNPLERDQIPRLQDPVAATPEPQLLYSACAS